MPPPARTKLPTHDDDVPPQALSRSPSALQRLARLQHVADGPHGAGDALCVPPGELSRRNLRTPVPASVRYENYTYGSSGYLLAYYSAMLAGMKSRDTGITEIRGPYYAPVTKTYLDEVLADWGEYIDGVKFAGGAFTLMPEDRLRTLIDTAHKHDTYVSTGGYIERVLAASGGNTSVVEKYIKTCADMGFDVLELSAGFLSIPTHDWAELIALVRKHGMKPKPEVGIQWGAGGDASVEELESAGTRDPKWLIDRAKLFLDAGASMIMIESEGITENVKAWRTDVISAVTSALPVEKIMFEAAEPDVFSYHIQNQGARANLFIDHSQIVQLACLRRGIWGTGATFGKIVTFDGKQK